MLVTTSIPVLIVSSIDVTKSNASTEKSETSKTYSKIVDVFCAINNVGDCPALCFVETDCKKYGTTSDTVSGDLPPGWERVSISSFGYTTWFCVRAPVQRKLLFDFTGLYFSKDWAERYISLESHENIVNVLLRMCISSSLTPVPLNLTDSMLAFACAQII